jgi:hypothetical protein
MIQLHVSSSLDKNLCAPCTDVFLFDGFIRYTKDCRTQANLLGLGFVTVRGHGSIRIYVESGSSQNVYCSLAQTKRDSNLKV